MGWFRDIVVGQAINQSSGQGDTSNEHSDPHRDMSGAKILPEVIVDRVDVKLSGDSTQLDVWVQLYNQSQFEVEVKQLDILGQSTKPGRYLKSQEKYVVQVYSGPTPKDDSQKDATIQYRIVDNSDYFQSDHIVSYKVDRVEEVDYYLPCDLRIVRPVRDV